MSYNGSGTFNINTAGQPVVTGTVISSSTFNALTADLGTGLSTALTKDGQTVATARIPFAQGINSSLVTDATSTTTGSIITAGGVGIAKALFVGTTANIAGTTTLAGVTATSITDSGLTSGRVTYAGTAGLLQDSANLTFNGTTLTANTIGAFTLGGTVAGGGNQLNNVIIGTTTPLAGAFTTLSASGLTTLGSVSSGIALAVTSSAATYTGSFINSSATSAGLLIKAGSTSGHEVLDVQTYNATSLLKVVASGATTVTGTLSATLNMSVGATLASWDSGYKATQYSWGSVIADNTYLGSISLGSNIYATGNETFSTVSAGTYYGARYRMDSNGAHNWYTSSAAVSAGAVTMTNTMTLGAAGGLAVTGTLSATSSGSFTQPSSTNTGLTVKSFSAAGGNQPLGVFQRSDAAVSIELGYDGGTGNCHIGTTTAHDFEIWRGGSVKATASSTGLAVTGTLSATGLITSTLDGNGNAWLSRTGATTNGQYMSIANTGGTIYMGIEPSAGGTLITGSTGYSLAFRSPSTPIQFSANAGASAQMTLDASGNLGLGVTPSAWNSTYNRAIQLLDGWASISSNNSQLCCDLASNAYNSDYFANTSWKYTNTGAQASLFQQQSGDFKFLTAASGTAGNTITFTTAMTLTAAGNLSNTASITSGTFTKATSYLWAAGVGTAGGVYLGSAGSSNGLISQASGGSGTTNTYIGNALITTVSDLRLKENVVDTTRNAIEILEQLRVVDHTWNDPSDQCENNRNSRGVWMGLIAQEAQPVIPWLVNKPTEDVDEDGNPQYWHMDYGYSVPLLIKAIQEQQAIIAALTTRITALENK